MVIWAKKFDKNFGILYFRKNGLHYFKIVGTNILVYGRTLDELFDEAEKILSDVSEMLRKGEASGESFVQKPSWIELLLLNIGACTAKIIGYGRNHSSKIDIIQTKSESIKRHNNVVHA